MHTFKKHLHIFGTFLKFLSSLTTQNMKTSSAYGVQSLQVCVQTNDVTGDLTLILGLCPKLSLRKFYWK